MIRIEKKVIKLLDDNIYNTKLLMVGKLFASIVLKINDHGHKNKINLFK